MSNRSKLIIILIPLIIVAVAILKISDGKGSLDSRRSAPVVKVEVPKHQTIVQSLNLTGDILSMQQAQVFAKVYGNVEGIYVNIGDFVHKDQLLARIDTTELAQQLQETAATYQNAVANLNRTKALRESNLASQQDLDNAETGLKVAEANYDAAQTRMGYAQVTAPFSGIITRRYLDPGAQVSSGSATLFTLMNLDVLKIMVNVQEKDIPLIKIGTKATITVDAYPNSKFEGSVVRQSQAFELTTRTMAVEIDVPNKDQLLKPGMFASVSLIISERADAITIPTQGILHDAKGDFVLIADNDTANRRNVKTGAEQESRTEILTGLQDNDHVIVAGQQFAKDGARIRVQQ